MFLLYDRFLDQNMDGDVQNTNMHQMSNIVNVYIDRHHVAGKAFPATIICINSVLALM